MSAFSEYFALACCESYSEHVVRSRKQSEAYQETEQGISQLFNEIKEKLGDDYKLIHRFEEALNRRAGMDNDWIYQQGFCDFMYLLRWMKAFAVG